MLVLEYIECARGSFDLSANFTVERGDQVAVIGPSGAGKSTLIEAIAGFTNITQGRILWQGADITNAPPGARPISMLFQDGNLFPHLTIEQNVGLGLSPSLRLSKMDVSSVHQSLERVSLGGLGARRPAELSGGQQSRAALARVLVQRRPVLLLDEPFAALGPALKREMLDLVSDLSAETRATILMITHDPDDARQATQKAIFVADNLAQPPQDTKVLLDNPPPALKDYLGR